MTYCVIVQVILFDVNSARYKIEEWRSELWDLAHVGIPDSDTESQDSLIFSQLTCWFISEVTSYFYYSIIIFIAYISIYVVSTFCFSSFVQGFLGHVP